MGDNTRTMRFALTAFNRKLQAAEKGLLTFGSGANFDVDHMRETEGVLELKWSNLPPGCEAKGLWLRLYFSEPAARHGKLVRLILTVKSSEDPGGAKQTQDSLDAERYLVTHCAPKTKRKPRQKKNRVEVPSE